MNNQVNQATLREERLLKSEITFDEIQSKLAIDLKNKVNSLKEPYP